MLQMELTTGINAIPRLKAFHESGTHKKWQRLSLALQPLATIAVRWDYSFDAQFSTECVGVIKKEEQCATQLLPVK
jgi:hypothetical protein